VNPAPQVPRVSRLLARPSRGFWLAAFLAWTGLLWWLSSRSDPVAAGPEIPHFDKFCHFVYFAAGGFLFAALLGAPVPRRLTWSAIVGLAILVLAGIGALDEWHQSHTPRRQGNDPADWAADLAGAALGAILLRGLASRPPDARPESSQFA
jgi:VanZ family protein